MLDISELRCMVRRGVHTPKRRRWMELALDLYWEYLRLSHRLRSGEDVPRAELTDFIGRLSAADHTVHDPNRRECLKRASRFIGGALAVKMAADEHARQTT